MQNSIIGRKELNRFYLAGIILSAGWKSFFIAMKNVFHRVESNGGLANERLIRVIGCHSWIPHTSHSLVYYWLSMRYSVRCQLLNLTLTSHCKLLYISLIDDTCEVWGIVLTWVRRISFRIHFWWILLKCYTIYYRKDRRSKESYFN